MTNASPRSYKRFFRKRGFWITTALLLPVLMIAALAITGCLASRMFEPGDETGLRRFEKAVTLDDTKDVTVSFLSSTTHDEHHSGPPIVYVHGTPGDATNWNRYLREPVGDCLSIAVDRLGFHKSENGGVFSSFADQAAALKPVLGDDERAAPILVGHSLGGPIIARAAADYPGRVAALVIVAGSLDPDLEEIKWYNHAMRSPLVSIWFPKAATHSNEEVIAARRETEELAERLKLVTCPVVIVHGTADSLVPFENVAYMKRQFTGTAQVEVIALPDADHFIIWTDAKAIREAIERARELVQVKRDMNERSSNRTESIEEMQVEEMELEASRPDL